MTYKVSNTNAINGDNFATSFNKIIVRDIRRPTAINFSGDLYAFTSFTFTTGGQTGYAGGNLTQFKASYNTSTYPWLNDTSFYNVTTLGFQLWTVPKTGTYTMFVSGAGGGQGGTYSNNNDTVHAGHGAILTFSRAFTKGHVISIAVGHKGESGSSTSSCGLGSGGGGGGTWVYNTTASQLIAVAGGGGGAGNDSGASSNYQPDGQNSNDGGHADSTASGGVPGGTAGTGGTSAFSSTHGCVRGGAGGGGYLGSGTTGSYINLSRSGRPGNGYSVTNPLQGGIPPFGNGGAEAGGFGGGGSSGYYCGGGGGGYSGGAGGGLASCSCSNLSGGGGGGSYYIDGLGSASFSLQSTFQTDGYVAVSI